MNISLKQLGENVGVYINKQLATVFEKQNINYVFGWIQKNWTNTTINII